MKILKDFAILFFLVVLGMVVHEFSKDPEAESETDTEEVSSKAASENSSLNKNDSGQEVEINTNSNEESSNENCDDELLFPAHLSSITLGVRDIDSSRQFYQETLGWKSSSISSKNIVFIKAGSMVISLIPLISLEQEMRSKFENSRASVKLAYQVESKEKVDRIFAELKAKNVPIVNNPSSVFWGGYSGQFEDPDGYIWEIAYNPHLKLNNDGEIVLPN